MTSSTGEQVGRRFSLGEIQLATGDFSDAHVIGKGGFGKVYRGLIDDGSLIVAVKRLASNSKQGEREFVTEMETLSKLRHRNLVSLIGYCKEQGEMILVYEYMPNGTLDDHLHSDDGSSLTWNERLRICIGAGRGLDYLHTGSSVIHRDVKPTNILLDANYTAKVSDFGLAKHLSVDNLESHVSASVKGSFGYFDPFYFISGRLTKASDTYAFGVVLLEVLSGRPAIDGKLAEDELCLTMWAQDKIRNKKFQQIVASSLRAEISDDCLKTFVGVVKRCLHHEPKKRLSMTRVVAQLELALEKQDRKGPTRKLQFRAFWNRSIPSGDTQKDNDEVEVNMLGKDALQFTQRIVWVDEIEKREKFGDRNGVIPSGDIGSTQQDNNGAEVKDELQSKQSVDRVDELEREQNVSEQIGVPGIQLGEIKEITDDFGAHLELALEQQDRKGSTRKSQLWAFWNRAKPSGDIGSTQKDNNEVVVNELGNDAMKFLQRINWVDEIDKMEKFGDRRNRVITSEMEEINGFPAIQLAEIKDITDNFGSKCWIADGTARGSIFRGVLKTGQDVAIKRHSKTLRNQEFLEQVSFLARLKHENVMELLGYCVDGDEQVLVYEFAKRGSLYEILHVKGGPELSWAQRVDIAVGVAKGLLYFHDNSLIHRNIKSSNVLLFDHDISKISDSHLSEKCPCNEGYIFRCHDNHPPESRFSEKGDVYNFGVVLLELLTGRKALGGQDIVKWTTPELGGNDVHNIVDARLKGDYPHKAVERMAAVAACCVQHDAHPRPNMDTVLGTLDIIKRETQDYISPTQPNQQETMNRQILAS